MQRVAVQSSHGPAEAAARRERFLSGVCGGAPERRGAATGERISVAGAAGSRGG